MFLVHSRQESRHILNNEQGNIECVAETDEPRAFDAGVDIESPGKMGRLICDDTHGIPGKPGVSDNYILRPMLMDRKEITVVDQMSDNIMHVVWFIRIIWDN